MANEETLKLKLVSETEQAKKNVDEFKKGVEDTGKSAKAAGDETKKLGEETEKAGKKAAEGSKETEKLGLAFQRMSSMELANRILQISTDIGHLGDITKGVAEGDVAKFEQGWQSASRAAVGAISLIAPELAPVVATLGVVIGEFVKWSSGIEDTRQKLSDINHELEVHISNLDRLENLAKAASFTSAETFKIEQDFLRKRLEANRQANYELLKNHLGTTEDSKKIDEEFWSITHKIELNEQERTTQIQKEAQQEAHSAREKYYKDTENQEKEHQRKLTEAERKSAEESRKQKEQDAKDSREEMSKALGFQYDDLIEDIDKKHEAMAEANQNEIDAQKFMFDQEADDRDKASDKLQDTLESDLRVAQNVASGEEDAARRRIAAYQKVAQSADATGKQRKTAEQNIANEMKHLYDQEVKTAEGYAKKATDVISGGLNQIIFEHKSFREVIDSLWQQLAQSVITTAVSMLGQVVAKWIASVLTTKAAAISEMTAKAISANAQFGLAGVATAAAEIAAMLGLVIPFEGGYTPNGGGSFAGLGRRDGIKGEFNSKEGVANETAMNTKLGDILGLLNQGTSQQGSVSSGGPVDVKVTIGFDADSIPADRTIVRALIGMINREAIQYGTEVVSNRGVFTIPN